MEESENSFQISAKHMRNDRKRRLSISFLVTNEIHSQDGDNSYNRKYAPRQDEFQKRNICSILFSKHLSAILRNNYLPQEKGLSEEVKQYK